MRAGAGASIWQALQRRQVPLVTGAAIVLLVGGIVALEVRSGGADESQVELAPGEDPATAEGAEPPDEPGARSDQREEPGADLGEQPEGQGGAGEEPAGEPGESPPDEPPADDDPATPANGRDDPGAPPEQPDEPAPTPGGRGVTDSALHVGFWIVNTDAGCGSLGLGQEGTSCEHEDRQQIAALVEDVNARGGVAGRELETTVFETDAASGSFSGQAQAACTAFTQDHEVAAVVSEGQIGRPFMASCLAEQGVPVVEPGFWPFDAELRSRLDGYLYQPTRPSPERWVSAYVDGLERIDFFDAGDVEDGLSSGVTDPRIALLRFDAAPFDRVTEEVLKPRLEQHGHELTEEFRIPTPDSMAGFGEMNQEISNAIVQMRSSGIDHVIFFATHGEMAVFYFQQAEAQRFRPAYGLTSMESMRLQSEQGPSAQFTDAVGVGWLPQFDVFPGDDPGGSESTERCREILHEAGLEGGAGRHAQCDNVFFLAEAFDRAPSLDAAGLRDAVEGLGRSWEPAGTFGAEFGPGRYDGPSGYRFTDWDSECECFRYVGDTQPMP